MNSSNANTFLRYKCQDSVLEQSIKTTKMMATFEILTTFKDGHFSKEGHRKNAVSRTSMIGSPLPKSTLFSNLLDYTSDTFRWSIWGRNVHRVIVMAILWLIKLSRQLDNILISLITLHLQAVMLFKKHRGRFRDLCLALNRCGDR